MRQVADKNLSGVSFPFLILILILILILVLSGPTAQRAVGIKIKIKIKIKNLPPQFQLHPLASLQLHHRGLFL